MGYRKDICRRAVKRFESVSKKFVVQQKHRDGDVVQLWRVGEPESSNYSFWICNSVGCLSVYGDMGEYMWMRCPDALSWARGAIGSLEYFSEKVPRNVEIREEAHELIEEWFMEFPAEWSEMNDLEWLPKQQEQLGAIRDEWENYRIPEDFKKAVYESQLTFDAEDIPDTTYYTFQYLFVREGLKWFIQQLDSGNAVKPGSLWKSHTQRHEVKIDAAQLSDTREPNEKRC